MIFKLFRLCIQVQRYALSYRHDQRDSSALRAFLWRAFAAEHALLHILSQTPYEVLDLLDLFDEESLPMDEEETRTQLLRSLRHKLQSFQVSSERRTVLVVKSIGLLARYRAGVREFYEWFCGDFAMVVLILDGLLDERAWPEEVACDADRLLKYFHEPGVVKEVFGEKG